MTFGYCHYTSSLLQTRYYIMLISQGTFFKWSEVSYGNTEPCYGEQCPFAGFWYCKSSKVNKLTNIGYWHITRSKTSIKGNVKRQFRPRSNALDTIKTSHWPTLMLSSFCWMQAQLKAAKSRAAGAIIPVHSTTLSHALLALNCGLLKDTNLSTNIGRKGYLTCWIWNWITEPRPSGLQSISQRWGHDNAAILTRLQFELCCVSYWNQLTLMYLRNDANCFHYLTKLCLTNDETRGYK